jgi:hypothetical protein
VLFCCSDERTDFWYLEGQDLKYLLTFGPGVYIETVVWVYALDALALVCHDYWRIEEYLNVVHPKSWHIYLFTLL